MKAGGDTMKAGGDMMKARGVTLVHHTGAMRGHKGGGLVRWTTSWSRGALGGRTLLPQDRGEDLVCMVVIDRVARILERNTTI